MKRTLLSLVLGVLCSGAALGQDDIEFARGLVRRGYFDLAEEILKKISSDPASAFVRAEMKLAKAESEPDVAKSQDLVDGSIEELKTFIKNNPGHKLVFEARLNVGWLYSKKAQLITDAIKLEPSPEKQTELIKRAEKIYEDAEKFYKDSMKEWLAAKQTPEIENALMDARLELPKVMLEHAQLAGIADGTRKPLLEEAIKFLIDYEYDYGDRPMAFEAACLSGRCHSELGNFKEAKQKLLLAISLRVRLAEYKITPNDYHWSIIKQGYLYLAEMHNREGKPKDALAVVEKAFKEIKGLDRDPLGLAMMLEQAQAYFDLGDSARCTSVIKKVEASDPNGKWGAMAREKMNRMTGGLDTRGKQKFTPEQMLTSAEGLIDKENWRDALQALRKCVEVCSTQADKDKYQPEAYYKMGQCFLQLKRNYEAAYAFENVFMNYPKHELAPLSCYQAVRCFSNEVNVSGDKRDEEMKDKYLTILRQKWPDHPSARNIAYLQAEKVENEKKYKEAAQLYMQVREDAEAYESALVRAGFCFYADAAGKWAKDSKSDSVKAEVKSLMSQAEDVLKKFLARLGDKKFEPKEDSLKKLRVNLSFIANQQLSLVYMHEAVGKTDECLTLLNENEKVLAADDERLGKIWSLKIQCHLTLKKLDDAVMILERMFERFPTGRAIAQACKSVAINLHGVTQEMIDKKGDETKIRDNLKKISKYYSKWLDEGPTWGLRITIADVVSVAETLYMIAKRLCGLEEGVISFLDLKKPIPESGRQYWIDAAFVHALLVEGKVGKLPEKERIELATRLARCYSFIANSLDDWEKAKTQYDDIVKSYKMIDQKTDQIDMSVLQRQPSLLTVYIELGYVYFEVGKKGQKFQFDNASTVFSNVIRVTQGGSEPWWIGKYMTIYILFERGAESDINAAKISLENVEKNSPDFDGDKFGMKTKFLELKEKILKVTGK